MKKLGNDLTPKAITAIYEKFGHLCPGLSKADPAANCESDCGPGELPQATSGVGQSESLAKSILCSFKTTKRRSIPRQCPVASIPTAPLSKNDAALEAALSKLKLVKI